MSTFYFHIPVTDESSAAEELVTADLDVEQGCPGELIRLRRPSADNSSLKCFYFLCIIQDFNY